MQALHTTTTSEPVATVCNSPKYHIDNLHLRLPQDPLDVDAWRRLADEVEKSGKSELIRTTYDALLKKYPDNPSVQIRYINHFLNDRKTFPEAEHLFQRFLKVTSPSVNLYTSYLEYIRYIHTGVDTQSQRIIRKAYDFAIKSIGGDKNSGNIWCDYIAFLKSGEISLSTSEEQQKIVRKAYQRALQTPLDNIDKIWRDYESFEFHVNRSTAREFLNNMLPAYTQARSVGRDLANHLDALYLEVPLTANSKLEISLPTVPSFTISERQLVGKWKNYLKWEESNPLKIEEERKTDFHTRIQIAYKKAFVRMRFYPEIWFMAYHWMDSVGRPKEAIAILKTGLEANPSSFLLTFAYVEVLEVMKNHAQAHAIYEQFLQLQKASIVELHGRVDEEKPSKHSPLTRKDYALVYITYMRFVRRTEGVEASRSLFRKARRDMYASWEIYAAGAIMEYHHSRNQVIATRIFEADAHALFERVISTLPAEESRTIWECWACYQHQYGDLSRRKKSTKGWRRYTPVVRPVVVLCL
ncbi:hypothetical protein C8J55DRAFT_538496 [Lentinula edodes]|uniref:mRNA 3'-end-processing protein RNA14 n=1 Tax=Lentinula lateritia TaxID=40482 RepID=A0A9W8ZST6_9AGAR|nr:hypothetical protein C8J55DRAFT_538496 [Lentinula edodes]